VVRTSDVHKREHRKHKLEKPKPRYDENFQHLTSFDRLRDIQGYRVDEGNTTPSSLTKMTGLLFAASVSGGRQPITSVHRTST